jgi:pilus assembly protein Flp/PilA
LPRSRRSPTVPRDHFLMSRPDSPARVRKKDKKMKSLFDSVKTFLVSEDGPTAVEYAVMLALIIIVCLTAIKAVGTTASDRFTDAKNGLTPAP